MKCFGNSFDDFQRLIFSVFIWRHGGHVDVQNNSEKKYFGNFILLLCKTWATFCHCFVLQHGRLITWVKTKNRVQIQLLICVSLSLATVGFCQEEVYPQKIVHKDQITTVIKQQSWRFECLPFVRAKRSIHGGNLTLSTWLQCIQQQLHCGYPWEIVAVFVLLGVTSEHHLPVFNGRVELGSDD